MYAISDRFHEIHSHDIERRMQSAVPKRASNEPQLVKLEYFGCSICNLREVLEVLVMSVGSVFVLQFEIRPYELALVELNDTRGPC